MYDGTDTPRQDRPEPQDHKKKDLRVSVLQSDIDAMTQRYEARLRVQAERLDNQKRVILQLQKEQREHKCPECEKCAVRHAED